MTSILHRLNEYDEAQTAYRAALEARLSDPDFIESEDGQRFLEQLRAEDRKRREWERRWARRVR